MNSYRHEKEFAFMSAAILAAIGLWPLMDQSPPSWAWLLAALVLTLIAWLIPVTLSPVIKLWLPIGQLLAFINSRIILALIFYLFITPIAILFRLIGRDSLQLKIRTHDSLWQKQKKKWPPDSFRNQF